MNKILVSVIIPTYNPNKERLEQTLVSLKNQTLANQNWEIIIVDNNSNNDTLNNLTLTDYHDQLVVVREPKQGLTYARLKGFKKAKGDYIVMVDDDNILDPNYLVETLTFFNNNPSAGSVGGKSIAQFENFTPEEWSKNFIGMLAVRDLGDELLVSDTKLIVYPEFSPIGAGMGLRKSVLWYYIDYIENNKYITTDRIGNSLASGGDNEINILILKNGFSVAYSPKLSLQHIIPSTRLTKAYLSKLSFESNVSWLKLLHKHGLSLWQPIKPWTLKIRFLKAWFKHQPWKSNTHFITWKGSCGVLKGLSENYISSQLEEKN